MKSRQRMKIFKIVAKQLQEGKELHPRHERLIHDEAGNFIDRLYVTEFRPWWYDQDWGERPLSVEGPKFFRQAENRFSEWSGIDIDLWARYWKGKKA